MASGRPCLAALLLLTSILYRSPAAEARLPEVQTVELTMANALFQGPQPTGHDCELMLELERADGQWQMVIGVAREYNVSIHPGYVAEARVDDKAVELRIAMRILADSWVPGGPAPVSGQGTGSDARGANSGLGRRPQRWPYHSAKVASERSA